MYEINQKVLVGAIIIGGPDDDGDYRVSIENSIDAVFMTPEELDSWNQPKVGRRYEHEEGIEGPYWEQVPGTNVLALVYQLVPREYKMDDRPAWRYNGPPLPTVPEDPVPKDGEKWVYDLGGGREEVLPVLANFIYPLEWTPVRKVGKWK